MPAPFSALVSSRPWRRAAERWAAARLADHGIRITGDVGQPRVRPWSTQLTIPTDTGTVWFKAACPAMAFEPALQSRIAELVPGVVQEPLAIEPERGWMLTADHGPSLSDGAPPTTAEWSVLLRDAARAQRELVGHRDAMLATGLPDCSPSTVPGRFDELRGLLRSYPDGHPARLAPEQDARLEAARPALVDACAVLAESQLPSSWNHGDLHPGNAYRTPRGPRYFDLGDGQWAHAVEALVVPVARMRAQGLPERDISDAVRAFLDEWNPDATRAEVRAARVTHAVNRSRTWWVWLDGTTPDELVRFAREPREQLMSMLDVIADDEGPDIA